MTVANSESDLMEQQPLTSESKSRSMVNEGNYAIPEHSVFDFEVIGGREEWIDFINKNRIYWTIFGLPVTVPVLVSVVATVVTSLGATGISLLMQYL